MPKKLKRKIRNTKPNNNPEDEDIFRLVVLAKTQERKEMTLNLSSTFSHLQLPYTQKVDLDYL